MTLYITTCGGDYERYGFLYEGMVSFTGSEVFVGVFDIPRPRRPTQPCLIADFQHCEREGKWAPCFGIMGRTPMVMIATRRH